MSSSHSRNPGNARAEFVYNPFELAFCGQAGSSRSTLVSRLARFAFTDRIVAHVDNDVPAVGGPGGEQAWVYCERTRHQHVVVHPPRKDDYIRSWPLLDADMAFVEEGRDIEMPKVVILDGLKNCKFHNVVAYVGRMASCAGQASGAPFFLRDDLDSIRDFILDHFRQQAARLPLYGLVLAGGLSTRMNTDKAALQYHGRPQVRHCWSLLDPLCEKVFVSCRGTQADEDTFRGLPLIPDTLLNCGPMGGILSAMRAHPEAAWLVLAVDLPFVDGPTLERLVQQRDPFKLATAYHASRGGLPEPLCAIYEPKSAFRLMHFMAQGFDCPRKVLVNSDTHLLQAENPAALNNVNEPGEYEEAKTTIEEQRRAAP